jgi:hypothetical protein
LARFKALQCRESGSWLQAIPSPNIGTLLDNTSFQVCIGLRLGCNLCTPHFCKCNAKVDEIGIHGLSCSKSSGRFSRHTEINSIINRSLTSIHVNSTLESNGLSGDDGKRPDGMSLVPWIKGQPLVCDVTIVDTLSDSYILKTSELSGFAAEMASKRKHSKYSSILSSNYVFKGLPFETLGPWCKEAIDFINVIGNRLIAESGDSKSKKFLFERISLAIQRGNAASIRGLFQIPHYRKYLYCKMYLRSLIVSFNFVNVKIFIYIQGYSRVIMGFTTIETQPVIHFHRLRESFIFI